MTDTATETAADTAAESTLDRLLRLLRVEFFGQAEVHAGSRLGADLQIDSLDVVELELALEDAYGCDELSLGELDELAPLTVAALAARIDGLLDGARLKRPAMTPAGDKRG